MKQYKQELIKRYQTKYPSGVNLSFFDFSETDDTDQLENVLKISSFFNEHKLVVCNSVFQRKPISGKVVEFIKDHKIGDLKDVTLMVIEAFAEKDLLTKNKELFKLLSDKNNTVKLFQPLEGSKLIEWIKNGFQSRGCSVDNATAKFLLDTVGNDGWSLVNEIEKLSNYKVGEIVTTADINKLVSKTADLSIFNLVDAVAEKNKNKAVQLLYQELKTGRDPYYILTMITYQIRNFIIISDLVSKNTPLQITSKKTSIHPYVVRKAVQNLSKFSFDELKNRFSHLSCLDISFKNGTADLVDSLYNFVLV